VMRPARRPFPSFRRIHANLPVNDSSGSFASALANTPEQGLATAFQTAQHLGCRGSEERRALLNDGTVRARFFP
jgi:hypothetical protein